MPAIAKASNKSNSSILLLNSHNSLTQTKTEGNTSIRGKKSNNKGTERHQSKHQNT